MNGMTKSILLQVAFKGAVAQGVVNEENVRSNYELLVSLHDSLGIDSEDRGSGFSGRRSGGTTRKSTPSAKPNGEVFTYQNILVEDFRQAKADPALGLKANYPDFKTVNGDVIPGITTDRGAAWIYTQDGEPVEATAPLVAAADAKVF